MYFIYFRKLFKKKTEKEKEKWETKNNLNLRE